MSGGPGGGEYGNEEGGVGELREGQGGSVFRGQREEDISGRRSKVKATVVLWLECGGTKVWYGVMQGLVQYQFKFQNL